jgi:hypothetical protein
MLYWDLGRQIVEKQEKSKWGSKLVEQLCKDLKEEFPDMKGFSKVNLFYMRRFYLFYSPLVKDKIVQQLAEISPNDYYQIVQQLAEQLHQPINQQDEDNQKLIQKLVMIPWWHHVRIIEQINDLQKLFFI